MDVSDELIAERDIRRLVALYPQYADEGNAEGFAGLFAEAGFIAMGDVRIEGRAAIATWLAATLDRGPMRHIMTNLHLVVDSESRAHGSLDMVLFVRKSDGWSVLGAPRYEDAFVKAGGAWKFASRIIRASL